MEGKQQQEFHPSELCVPRVCSWPCRRRVLGRLTSLCWTCWRLPWLWKKKRDIPILPFSSFQPPPASRGRGDPWGCEALSQHGARRWEQGTCCCCSSQGRPEVPAALLLPQAAPFLFQRTRSCPWPTPPPPSTTSRGSCSGSSGSGRSWCAGSQSCATCERVPVPCQGRPRLLLSQARLSPGDEPARAAPHLLSIPIIKEVLE